MPFNLRSTIQLSQWLYPSLVSGLWAWQTVLVTFKGWFFDGCELVLAKILSLKAMIVYLLLYRYVCNLINLECKDQKTFFFSVLQLANKTDLKGISSHSGDVLHVLQICCASLNVNFLWLTYTPYAA